MKLWTRRAVLAGMAGAVLGPAAFLNSARFGELPSGERLDRIRRSPNWQDGEFRNLEPFQIITSEESVPEAWGKWLFRETKGIAPESPLPVVRTDLKALDPNVPAAVWLGHSSVFFCLAGMRILVDPVFSEHAAPLPVAVRAFPGTNAWKPEDVPDLDLMLISHDHWDHLDCPTVQALAPRTKAFACPLGCGAHLERFGVPVKRIRELDWHQWTDFGPLAAGLVPSLHFSGRLWTRNRTLWGGFVLEGAGKRICFTGDGGYGRHFRETGARFKGGFDLVLPDTGQWNPRWAQVHMFPGQAALACTELGARMVLPVHVGKFALSTHAWDAPFRLIAQAAAEEPWTAAFPRIGEPVFLDGRKPPQDRWWDDAGRGSPQG